MADVTQEEKERAEQRELPDRDAAREWLESMMLIRRFEERAGEMYAKAKVGGFLHLAIGEEATIVGAVRAMRDEDYLISTYRSHGHALARGADPDKRDGRAVRPRGRRLAAAAAARCTCSTSSSASWAATGSSAATSRSPPGMALSSDYRGTEEVTLCVFGDGASNQGTFGETLNLAALWKLPVVFMVTNNQFGMGTALERHSARHRPAPARRGLRRARHALRRHGRARHLRGDRRGAQAGARGAPAGARRGDHLPLPRPLDGRPRGVPHQGAGRGVAQAGPDPGLRAQARGGGHPRGGRGREAATRRSSSAIDDAVAFADKVDVPAARVALRRHLRARRPGQGLVLGRRALRRRAPRRGRARARRAGARPDGRLRRGGRAGRSARTSGSTRRPTRRRPRTTTPRRPEDD